MGLPSRIPSIPFVARCFGASAVDSNPANPSLSKVAVAHPSPCRSSMDWPPLLQQHQRLLRSHIGHQNIRSLGVPNFGPSTWLWWVTGFGALNALHGSLKWKSSKEESNERDFPEIPRNMVMRVYLKIGCLKLQGFQCSLTWKFHDQKLLATTLGDTKQNHLVTRWHTIYNHFSSTIPVATKHFRGKFNCQTIGS